ncbi:hypothetical protein GF325_07580 [Candidatus Bathyarchaeota archaeon]|nr:hypothetical protein [Candidatus Bathyarchaeota archaeon]
MRCIHRKGWHFRYRNNIFFHGGAILDGGHTFGKNGEKNTFLPSSASRAGPAPVLYHRSMPREWQVVLAIPELHKGAHDQQEVNIFQEYCPVSIKDVRTLCHLLLMVILPAIETRSFSSLCEGINRIQSTGFKKVEIDIRGDSIKTLMEQLKDAGAPCVGMSSFGPTLYALARNNQQAEEIRDNVLGLGYPMRECIITRFNNHGAEVKLLDG